MSKVGSLTAFAAEASLWLAGAAIVAGAAGAHWDTPSVDLNALWPAASPSLVKDFTTTISADDFQASGSVIGTVSVTISGQKIDGTYSGTSKFKGNDSASTITMTMAGTKTTNDSVSVGDSDYSRTNDGAWTKTARSTTGTSFRVLTAEGVTDKGVELHDGQKLHHLDLVKTPDPKSLFKDPTMVNGQYTVVMWAKDDGTPAGMTIAGSYSQDVNGSLAQAAISLDFNFESLSGVTIDAPPS
ncbi:MAG: hypothetical protein ACXWNR_05445 [Candidatus Limnocylindrales bacterium]